VLAKIPQVSPFKITQDRGHRFWPLQTVGWAGWVTLFSLRDAYWGHAFKNLLLLSADAIVGLTLTTLLRNLYRAVWERDVRVRVVTVLVASYGAAAIWQPVKNLLQFDYTDNFSEVAEYGLGAYFNGIIGYSYFLMLLWSYAYFGLKFYELLQEERQRSIRAESPAHESQLRMLRYQLNPHFLFNTLNAISTLIVVGDNGPANSMVSKLSSFLRDSLDKDPMQKVDLTNEIESMQLYLDIEEVRFDERLTVDIDIGEGSASALVRSLILAPLVENSIKYAIARMEGGSTIRIASSIEDRMLCLKVSDDGPACPSTREAIPWSPASACATRGNVCAICTGRPDLVG
jgi:signal transduction histidine kinase